MLPMKSIQGVVCGDGTPLKGTLAHNLVTAGLTPKPLDHQLPN